LPLYTPEIGLVPYNWHTPIRRVPRQSKGHRH
jgi:hypothetical protein